MISGFIVDTNGGPLATPASKATRQNGPSCLARKPASQGVRLQVLPIVTEYEDDGCKLRA
jgi:hypothetical protein